MAAAPKRKEISIYRHLLAALFCADLSSSFIRDNVRFLLSQLFPGAAHGELEVTRGFYGDLLTFLVCLAAIYAWARPIHLWLGGKRAAVREKAVARFNGIYRLVFGLAAFTMLSSLLRGLLAGHRLPVEGWDARDFWVCLGVPSIVEAYYNVYFMISYLEPFLFDRMASRFYDEDSIFRRKTGLGLRIKTRLFLMVLNLAVVPMVLLVLDLAVITDFGRDKVYPLSLIGVALVFLVGNSEMLYRAVARPLSELVKKLDRLAQGDFTVKTTVLSDDEIGSLKAHFNDMVDGMAERERVKDTFGKYMSIEIARQLLSSGKIELGGESIEATILFSDIRDFTPLSERMSAREVVAFLNKYFSKVVAPIMAHHGVVNKFIGDAVMAIFAPQFGSVRHVDDAVEAALGMRMALAEFNREGHVPREVRFGVGLHTGVLVAGNIGTERRLEYTVIGDTVNVASRIESSTKALDSVILLSEEVHRGMAAALRERLVLERCEDVRLKGKDRPLTLYKVQ